MLIRNEFTPLCYELLQGRDFIIVLLFVFTVVKIFAKFLGNNGWRDNIVMIMMINNSSPSQLHRCTNVSFPKNYCNDSFFSLLFLWRKNCYVDWNTSSWHVTIPTCLNTELFPFNSILKVKSILFWHYSCIKWPGIDFRNERVLLSQQSHLHWILYLKFSSFQSIPTIPQTA